MTKNEAWVREMTQMLASTIDSPLSPKSVESHCRAALETLMNGLADAQDKSVTGPLRGECMWQYHNPTDQ
jgi:hypothetical protein